MAFKDIYDDRYVRDLAAAIQEKYPPFDGDVFYARVFDDEWTARELMDRMRHIRQVLHDMLPADYEEALAILRQAAPQLAHRAFASLVFCDFVGAYGPEHWRASIPALEQFTRIVSAEYAVRPIVHDRERMMAQMLVWAQSEDADLRRLASEGCRPRLPWGIRLYDLQADPSPILPILEILKDDLSESVRRSVANNLNDIAKDHPDLVLDVLRRWQEADTDEIRWIIKHALRTLLKAGDPEALALIGFAPDPQIEVCNVAVEPQVIPVGGAVTLSFEIRSTGQEPQQLMIDYVVYMMGANGKQRTKVWKLSQRSIAPGETISICRQVSFRPVTTRKYYPGEHVVAPQINGKLFQQVDFVLE
jgi:3-methyladenine DNA glycosylase AlkC